MSEKNAQRTATLSGRVQNQLNLLSASMRRTYVLYAVLMILFAAIIAVLLTGLIDYFWPLATSMRALSILIIGAGSLFLLIKSLLAIRGITPFEAAVNVEHAHPELGQRLRTAWQFRAKNMNTSASPQLVDAMIEDTNARTEGMGFSGIVSHIRLIPATAAVVLAIVLGLAALIWIPESRITFARLTLFPIHYSHVEFDPPVDPITAGSAITLDAEVTGRPVPKAALLVRKLNSDEPWTRIPMASGNHPKGSDEVETSDDADAELSEILGKVSAKLDDCQYDLEYKIVAGPVVTPTHQLRVLQPLVQESFSAKVAPPEYTGLEPENVEQLAITAPGRLARPTTSDDESRRRVSSTRAGRRRETFDGRSNRNDNRRAQSCLRSGPNC